jgi:hypothetical protein
MRSSATPKIAADRHEPLKFFGHVCIASDAKRDQNQKSKFSKMKNRKSQK